MRCQFPKIFYDACNNKSDNLWELWFLLPSVQNNVRQQQKRLKQIYFLPNMKLKFHSQVFVKVDTPWIFPLSCRKFMTSVWSNRLSLERNKLCLSENFNHLCLKIDNFATYLIEMLPKERPNNEWYYWVELQRFTFSFYPSF